MECWQHLALRFRFDSPNWYVTWVASLTRRSNCRHPYPHRIRCRRTCANRSPHRHGSPAPPRAPRRAHDARARAHPPRGWTCWQRVEPICNLTWTDQTSLGLVCSDFRSNQIYVYILSILFLLFRFLFLLLFFYTAQHTPRLTVQLSWLSDGLRLLDRLDKLSWRRWLTSTSICRNPLELTAGACWRA